MSLTQLFYEQVNTTGVSLNERFGNLGTIVRRPEFQESSSQQVTARIPPPTTKNIEFVEELRRKSTARNASNLQRQNIRTRLGVRGMRQGMRLRQNSMQIRPPNLHARLGMALNNFRVRGRGVARRGMRSSNLRRTPSLMGLKRSSSLASLTNVAPGGRARSRSRGRINRPLFRQQSRSRSRGGVPLGAGNSGELQRSRSRSRINQQGGPRSRSRSRGRLNGAGNPNDSLRRGRPRGRGRGGFQRVDGLRARSRSRSRPNVGSAPRGRGGRGRGGRGRGRGRGPQQPPNKDELDQQLDQYMSGSKENEDALTKSNAMDITWP